MHFERTIKDGGLVRITTDVFLPYALKIHGYSGIPYIKIEVLDQSRSEIQTYRLLRSGQPIMQALNEVADDFGSNLPLAPTMEYRLFDSSRRPTGNVDKWLLQEKGYVVFQFDADKNRYNVQAMKAGARMRTAEGTIFSAACTQLETELASYLQN